MDGFLMDLIDYDFAMEADTDDEDIEYETDDFDEELDEAEEGCCGKGKVKCKTAKEAYSEWKEAGYGIATENFVKSAIEKLVNAFKRFAEWCYEKMSKLDDKNPIKKVYMKFSATAKRHMKEAQEAKTQEDIDRLSKQFDDMKDELKKELAKLKTNEKGLKDAVAARAKMKNEFVKGTDTKKKMILIQIAVTRMQKTETLILIIELVDVHRLTLIITNHKRKIVTNNSYYLFIHE